MPTPKAIPFLAKVQLSAQNGIAEKKYWKKFFSGFCDYLHRQDCYDNYVGTMMKTLSAVLQYARDEKLYDTAAWRKELYVPAPTIA